MRVRFDSRLKEKEKAQSRRVRAGECVSRAFTCSPQQSSAECVQLAGTQSALRAQQFVAREAKHLPLPLPLALGRRVALPAGGSSSARGGQI